MNRKLFTGESFVELSNRLGIKSEDKISPFYRANFHDAPDLVLGSLINLNWLQVTEARKEYFMSDASRSYTYGKGDYAREYHSSPYTRTVLDMLEVLNGFNNEYNSYNVCFLNRYDTQKNQLGWHADDSPTMDRNHPIAVVSFGAEREIWWRENGQTGKDIAGKQRLASGSLFVMPAGFQDGYQHRIPKCDRECGVRISLTFRRYA